MYQRILIAVDKKAGGGLVFQEGLALARATRASVMLLDVLSAYEEDAPFQLPSTEMYAILNEEAIKNYLNQWQNYEQAGLDLLKTLAAEANANGILAEYSLNRGEPGRVICDLARNWNADLIMLAGREREELLGQILGSVSNYVTHHAPCSVLIVHP
jgi:nucleotide-binding universal stress UspA family protein